LWLGAAKPPPHHFGNGFRISSKITSPFEKGGSRGIYLKNLPRPLFFKEGAHLLFRIINFGKLFPTRTLEHFHIAYRETMPLSQAVISAGIAEIHSCIHAVVRQSLPE
jgi:hypothetical protein